MYVFISGKYLVPGISYRNNTIQHVAIDHVPGIRTGNHSPAGFLIRHKQRRAAPPGVGTVGAESAWQVLGRRHAELQGHN